MVRKINVLSPEMLFNLLSDATRLHCLALISHANELCVCELTYALNVVQPKISRHLALLREYNIIIGRREGQWVYYQLNRQLPNWMKKVITLAAMAVVDAGLYQQALKRLRALPRRSILCKKGKEAAALSK